MAGTIIIRLLLRSRLRTQTYVKVAIPLSLHLREPTGTTDKLLYYSSGIE